LTEWFEEVFGRKPGERKYPPFLRIDEGQEVVVTFLEDEPRLVHTRFGKRPMINVEVDGREYTLVLSHVDLAEKVALLQQENGGSLAGLRVVIARLPSTTQKAQYRIRPLDGEGPEG